MSDEEVGYFVEIPAKASGKQFWLVKAKSSEDAIEKIRAGYGEYLAEEMDVDSLDFDGAEASLDKQFETKKPATQQE